MFFKMNGMRSGISLIGLAFIMLLTLTGCKDDNDQAPELQLTSLQIDNQSLLDGTVDNASVHGPIIASFSTPVETASFADAVSITDDQNNTPALRFNFFNENKNVSIYPEDTFLTYTAYTINFTNVISANGNKTFSGSDYTFVTAPGQLILESISAGTIDLASTKKIANVPADLQIRATFSAPLDEGSISGTNVYLKNGHRTIATSTSINGNVLEIEPVNEIDYWAEYRLVLDTTINGIGAIDFGGFETSFTTALDSTLKFPEISEEELLTKVQQQTFKYFWDFGHPTSGLSRERNTSGNLVTIGGSGFGIMAIIVGIERGFITREEGIDRLDKIITFLGEKADRFHGVWSHWLDGTTGDVIPFSSDDNGGDLVETAFMVQGLLTVRQYLSESDSQEAALVSKINALWESVEWDWYTQNDQNALYWHWSPNYGWQKNHRISGWNEALIVYVLAASSPTHTIDQEVYTTGWARSGAIRNAGNNSYYGHTLPLRTDRGGPLFFAHYSFLGLDPRNLQDQYADYWEQNVTHTLINRAYSIDNPKNYLGYSANSWGLTASDGNSGYSAHSPDNDRGVITPTAALSSFPYTPEYSMDALKFFYYILGDRLWGEYGFYDAFNASAEWTASSYLAIDQGPIIVMIENYRTGLLWELFMSAPEVQNGLIKLDFTYE